MLDTIGLWYDQSTLLYDLYSRGYLSRYKKRKTGTFNWTSVIVSPDEKRGNKGFASATN